MQEIRLLYDLSPVFLSKASAPILSSPFPNVLRTVGAQMVGEVDKRSQFLVPSESFLRPTLQAIASVPSVTPASSTHLIQSRQHLSFWLVTRTNLGKDALKSSVYVDFGSAEHLDLALRAFQRAGAGESRDPAFLPQDEAGRRWRLAHGHSRGRSTPDASALQGARSPHSVAARGGLWPERPRAPGT